MSIKSRIVAVSVFLLSLSVCISPIIYDEYVYSVKDIGTFTVGASARYPYNGEYIYLMIAQGRYMDYEVEITEEQFKKYPAKSKVRLEEINQFGWKKARIKDE